MSVAVRVIVVLCACKASPPKPEPARDGEQPRAEAPKPSRTCLADELGELRYVRDFDACTETDSCSRDCERGDAAACMHEAYAFQTDDDDAEAQAMFGRACTLGAAIGCVNYGAKLWIEDDGACARRLFERSCHAYEPIGCGMFGRMMAKRARTPEQREAARQYFERICRVYGDMTCRMYAFHLEDGDLGVPADPKTIKALMTRACETGDYEACDKATASETFH